ncbi:MAG: polyhydroxyalkanoic acid system family protein [Proteobacteria bacterium]|nr:polyhydroxyalkanoic acid system family protein [Pseudomonadota bacterium]
MSDIHIERPHNLPIDELRQRLDKLAAELGQKFGIVSSWSGDICHLKGSTVKNGELKIGDSGVSIDITLGMMGKIFKKPIEDGILARIDDVLS